MKNKKGQITIFIILAIIIIAAVGIYFLIKPSVQNKTNVEGNEDLYNFVSECIEETTEKGIYYVSSKGGYFNTPEKSTLLGTAYYLDDGNILIPSKEKISEEIQTYVKENLPTCINGFSLFTDRNIMEESIFQEINIGEGFVQVKTKYPLTIIRSNTTTTINDFGILEFQIPLNKMYEIALEFVKEQKGYDELCLSCIINPCIENNFLVNLVDLEEGTSISIIDENLELNEDKFELAFAIN